MSLQGQGQAPQQAPQPVQTGSLWVGDLNYEVAEHHLIEKFSPIGQIASIRVCRDSITRRSLGYAYVNFVNAADAERALDVLNFEMMAGRPMRIMWSQRDPSIRRANVGNIFIKNLSKSIDHKNLYDTFSTFGNILSCKVACDASGKSKGYGFVHFESKQAADAAIQKVHGMMLKTDDPEDESKPVVVQPFQSRRDRGVGAPTDEFLNVYIKNLPDEWSDDVLGQEFSKFGEITSKIVMRDTNGKSKNFGFVNFGTTESAKAAVQEMNDKEFLGKKLYVARAQKKAERVRTLRQQHDQRPRQKPGLNLYVKNLDDEMTADRLRETFAPFGQITSSTVMMDRTTGRSRGFGFVAFTSEQEASNAIVGLNGALTNNTKPLYVALHVTKAERQIQIQQRQQFQYNRGMYPQFPVPMVPMNMMNMNMNMYTMPQQVQMSQQRQARPPRFAAGGQSVRPAQPRINQGRPMNMPGQMRQLPQQLPRLNPADLASLPPEAQKQQIGNLLYPQIAQMNPALAPKITGMLLELETSELLHLLEDPVALQDKVSDAATTLAPGSRH